MLTLYDEALVRFFQQIRWQGRLIPVVVAGPERAHAQVKEWLKVNNNLEMSQACGDRAMPYPFIAIYLGLFDEEPKLANPAIYRHVPDPRIGYGFAIRRPKPIKAQADVNVYFSSREQARHIEAQIHNLFPEKYAWVDINFDDARWYTPPNEGFQFARMWGQQMARIEHSGLVDNSSLEQSSLNDREIRYTLTCILHGWMPYQPYAVPLVNSFEIQLIEGDSEEELVTVTIPSE